MSIKEYENISQLNTLGLDKKYEGIFDTYSFSKFDTSLLSERNRRILQDIVVLKRLIEEKKLNLDSHRRVISTQRMKLGDAYMVGRTMHFDYVQRGFQDAYFTMEDRNFNPLDKILEVDIENIIKAINTVEFTEKSERGEGRTSTYYLNGMLLRQYIDGNLTKDNINFTVAKKMITNGTDDEKVSINSAGSEDEAETSAKDGDTSEDDVAQVGKVDEDAKILYEEIGPMERNSKTEPNISDISVSDALKIRKMTENMKVEKEKSFANRFSSILPRSLRSDKSKSTDNEDSSNTKSKLKKKNSDKSKKKKVLFKMKKTDVIGHIGVENAGFEKPDDNRNSTPGKNEDAADFEDDTSNSEKVLPTTKNIDKNFEKNTEKRSSTLSKFFKIERKERSQKPPKPAKETKERSQKPPKPFKEKKSLKEKLFTRKKTGSVANSNVYEQASVGAVNKFPIIDIGDTYKDYVFESDKKMFLKTESGLVE